MESSSSVSGGSTLRSAKTTTLEVCGRLELSSAKFSVTSTSDFIGSGCGLVAAGSDILFIFN